MNVRTKLERLEKKHGGERAHYVVIDAQGRHVVHDTQPGAVGEPTKTVIVKQLGNVSFDEL